MSSSLLDEKPINRSEPINHQLSVYIPMPDGVKIAVEVWLPDDFVAGSQVPVAVSFTRYWRVAEGQAPRSRLSPLRQSGIAVALVDCRGTGASFGHRKAEYSGIEVADFAQVIEWLDKQHWSSGVVSSGVSYCANTAEFSLFDAPSALKAAIPLFSDFDFYRDVFFPGGLLNTRLLKPWGEGMQAIDRNETEGIDPLWEKYRNQSIKPVDEDRDKQQLKKALEEHQRNVPVNEYLTAIECRDEFNLDGTLDHSDRILSPHLMQNNQRLREIPTYHWASFTDAGTAAGAIARFLASSAPMRVVIGYWTHGGEFGTSPFKSMGLEPSPTVDEQWQHIADSIHRYCDEAVDKNNTDFFTERALYYYTAGEERWKKTQVWPPVGIKTQQWFLNEHHTLSLDAPNGKDGNDGYNVDFEAGTGAYPRWDQIVKEVHYGDRAEPDKKCLTYTSAPLNQAIEITGHPVVYLQMSSTNTDGAVIVYLESVAPNGEVTLLTEGGLRLIHRKVSSESPSYPHFGPYHTFEKKDVLPMPVGEVVEVGFECLPLSVRVEKGHALRVAIAGHDKDCFERLPQQGDVTFTIFRATNASSLIELPMRYLSGSLSESTNSKPVNPFQV